MGQEGPEKDSCPCGLFSVHGEGCVWRMDEHRGAVAPTFRGCVWNPAMDALRAELARKRRRTQEAFGGKKYAKWSEVDAKVRGWGENGKKREEEAKDASAVEKEGVDDTETEQRDGKTCVVPVVKRDEAVRRLRLMGEPATLFGEDDEARTKRLMEAEAKLEVEADVVKGGQQANEMLEIDRIKAREEKKNKERAIRTGNVDDAGTSGNALEDAFRKAAQAIKLAREEENMGVEDKIRTYLRRLLDEWELELEDRSEEVKNSVAGKNAQNIFLQTKSHFKPLMKQLKKRQLPDDMRAGLWLMVKAMKDRNYVQAHDVYLKISIGNAAWPIGVTSVGIHERSAREKISFHMNGQAHIMNDEATRKYLQGIKRLMTFTQRKYPTDPSRSVEFNAVQDPSFGGLGDFAPKHIVPAPGPAQTTVPHFHDERGAVIPPPRWEATIRAALKESGS